MSRGWRDRADDGEGGGVTTGIAETLVGEGGGEAGFGFVHAGDVDEEGNGGRFGCGERCLGDQRL